MLQEDLLYDPAVDISQTVVASAVSIGKSLVIQPHQVQDGCMQVVDVNFVFHRMPTEFIRRSVNVPSFDSPTCHPHGEAKRMMFATVPTVRSWRTTKLPAPNN